MLMSVALLINKKDFYLTKKLLNFLQQQHRHNHHEILVRFILLG